MAFTQKLSAFNLLKGEFMSVRFCPIRSGSSGNCIYVGSEKTNILIDAGLSGKTIKEGLESLKINPENIDALFITHEHKDHIKGAGIISRRYNIPIYATPGTWEAMEGEIGAVAPKNIKYVYSGENCIINDVCVTPFELPHDAKEPVGYSFYTSKNKVSVATDLGHITDTVKDAVSDSNVLLLEANHDIKKLKEGSYPFYLKQRILGEKGHISNETAGNFLAQLVNDKLKYVYLGHLSDENNTPELAFKTVLDILAQSGIETGTYLKMDYAARYSMSKEIII